MKMLKQIMEEFCGKEINLPKYLFCVSPFELNLEKFHCVKFFGAEIRAFSSKNGQVIFFSWEENDDENEHEESSKYVLAYFFHGKVVFSVDYAVGENEQAANEFISDCQNVLYPFGEVTPDYFSQEFVDYCSSFNK